MLSAVMISVVHEVIITVDSLQLLCLPLGQVEVGVEGKFLVLVLRLEFPSFVSGVGLEGPVQSQLKAWHQLLVVHSSVEAVVGVPLLGDVDPVVLAFILGLQTAGDLASIHGRVPSSSKLNATGGLGLDLQLDQSKVISLAKHISGLLANVSVGWRSHSFDSVLQSKKLIGMIIMTH